MAKSLDYELREFDEKTLANTKASWTKQLEKLATEVLPTDYEAKLDWAAKNIDYVGGNPDFAYGVFRTGSAHADAIVDVVYQKGAGRRWLKLMGVQLAPSMDLAFNKETPNIHVIGEIFSTAILGTLKLTKAHPAKVTKLYGRSGTLLAFLKGFATALQESGGLKEVTVTMEGRWLVFRAH